MEEIETKYAAAGSLQAQFNQINETAATGQKKTSSGVILIKWPDEFRWETQQPDPSLLISDGKTFWFYTPPFDSTEHGQVIIRKVAQVQSKLASALLSGRFSAMRGMQIKQLSPGEFELHPKKGSASTVRVARVTIDLAQKVIQKVVLEHEGGNRAEISLSHIELGKSLGEEPFHFVPPPNTDRVTE